MTDTSTTPGASLPDGWHRTGPDQIGTPSGARITKSHIATATGVHPVYHAYSATGAFVAATPDLSAAVSHCQAFEARRLARLREPPH